MEQGTQTIYIGEDIDTIAGDGVQSYVGSMSGIYVYNSALTQAQFNALMYANQVNSGNLPATTPVSITAGAGLDLNGGQQTIASLSGVAGANVFLGGGVLTLSGTGGSTTYPGSISDLGGASANTGGSLVMAGPGLQNLAGSNSYSGGTQVTGGTLQLGNVNALGSGGLAANGGVLDLAGLSVTVSSLSGAAGTVTTSVAQPVTLTVAQSGTTFFGGTLQNGAGTLGLVFNGANGGLLNLSGANTYSGGTHIVAGVLQLGGNSAMNNAGALTINSGGLLDLNGNNAGVGALNGSGTIDNVAGQQPSLLTLGLGNNGGSFSGTIQNTRPTATWP